MNERIRELAEQAWMAERTEKDPEYKKSKNTEYLLKNMEDFHKKFAELIVKEMCGMMEQAEDDAYHCFEPSERPTEYIEWLRDWQERFTKHFGVEE